jgi:hypothetical protein
MKCKKNEMRECEMKNRVEDVTKELIQRQINESLPLIPQEPLPEQALGQ